ncbi:AraC family transcriptional regulator [Vacuolonema iberomarrocanum]|uniref:AraC family transcriptional regulator n=1 Tax=Vacuolonema iberomarrocanum TaxID=3454632 RepID=UPI0019EB646F|nr:AraC family transcriptional regulator [filamentous cyanobacterium LEGE 07170]
MLTFNTYKPNHYLSDFVKYYWQLELNSNSQTTHTERVIPSGELQIIFHYRTPFTEISNQNQSSIQPQCLIDGPQTEYKDIVTAPGSVGMIAVVLYPYALRAFFPNSVSEFTNQSIPLDNVVSTKTKELQERIVEVNSTYPRILLIEQFLLSRLSIHNDFSITREAVNILTKANGQLTVSEVANELNISKRQLERIFLRNIGISPKKFGRIIRFNTTIKCFEEVESLTKLTYKAGYFDLSHLIHDFREFTGLSPKEFFDYPCQI